MAQSSKQRAEAEVLDLKSKLRQLNKAVAEKGVSLEENAPLIDTIKAVEGLTNELTVSNGADVIYIDRPYLFSGWGMTSFKPKIIVKEDYNKKDLSGTFRLCTKLSRMPEIEGLDGVNSISSLVSGCDNLKEIALPDMPKVLFAHQLASGCRKLIRVKIGAMPYCYNLSNAFYGCTNLRTVTIGDCPKVNSMTNTFEGCSSLISITIDLSNNSEMKSMFRAFFGCSSLKTITGIIAYPDIYHGRLEVRNAFDGCTSLQEVRIKNLWSTIDLSDCQRLSMESVRYLVENAKIVTAERIDLSSKLLDSHKEELDALGAVASGKGWTLNYR